MASPSNSLTISKDESSQSSLEEAKRLHAFLKAFEPSQLQPRKAGEPPCSTCRKIFHVIYRSKLLYFKLGDPTELSISDCQYHHHIIAHVLSTFQNPIHFANLGISNSDGEQNVFAGVGTSPTSLRIFQGNTNDHDMSFELLPHSGRRKFQGYGRVIDSKWIDHNLLRSWERRCAKFHGSSCHPSRLLDGPYAIRPDLLIDTWKLCLVKPLGDLSYVALSYVWGDAPTLQTNTATLKRLQQDRALAHFIEVSEIPKTVVHAMHLVGVLRMRYLWVDSLCIVQDDDNVKHHQIQNMASIYANASLTIVAAEGNHANHGIRGIRNVSEPRALQQNIFTLPGRIRVCEVPLSELSQTKWCGRTWTFQEYLFSSRLLIFGDNRVRWQCPLSNYREDVDFLTHSDWHRQPITGGALQTLDKLADKSWPNLASYGGIVRRYNERQVTYAKDANLAFAGFCTVLHPKYDGGFLHGLPEMFFDVALLWQPASVLKRRVYSAAVPASSPDSMLPSWSWMGWRGEIDSWSWQNGVDFVKSTTGIGACMTSVRTVGILDWYAGSAGSDYNTWRKVAVSSRKYSYLSGNNNDILPPGWSRHDFNFMSLSSLMRAQWSEKRSVTTIFKHESDHESEFWWPIPIPQNTSEAKPLQSQTDLLFCRTTRA